MQQCPNHSGHEAIMAALVRDQERNQMLLGEIIREQRNTAEAVGRLTVLVEHSVSSVKSTAEAINEQGDRISALEAKPGTLALKSWAFVLGAVASAVLTFVLSQTGL
jgi:hypothetical protein